MGVAVMVMPMVVAVYPNRLKLRRSRAAMCRLTAGDFKLNSRVSNVEALTQGTVDTSQNIAAFRHRHLGDGYVAGERMRLRAKTPHMQVVNVEYAVD